MTAYPTNRDRGEWANLAVEAFASVTRISGEDLDTKVADLLADLQHLCADNGVSFQGCLERAETHYRAEIDEDADDAAVLEANNTVCVVASEYAELFNKCPIEDIDRLIADACVDPLWDDRTNLLSLLADEPQDLGLVLATDAQNYAVVRLADGVWIVDSGPVDWEALEDRAFAPYEDDDSGR